MVMVTTQGMTCFFEASTPLSNWHPAQFTYRGIEFGNTEQFMMYCKAKLFNDHETAEKILRATTPREQKALGRQVRNFDDRLWNEKCEGYVRVGCLEKFRQNPALATVLLETGATELVEASPYDKIWGVGLAHNDPRIQDKAQWRGQNRLGNVLMQVRETLVQEMTRNSKPLEPVPNGATLATNGRFVGRVADVTNCYVIQESAPNVYVAHKLSDFDKHPVVGRLLDVQCRDGKAMVHGGEQSRNSQSQSRER